MRWPRLRRRRAHSILGPAVPGLTAALADCQAGRDVDLFPVRAALTHERDEAAALLEFLADRTVEATAVRQMVAFFDGLFPVVDFLDQRRAEEARSALSEAFEVFASAVD